RQIAYSAQIQFKAPVAPPGAMAADIRGTLDRSTMIANPRGVDVQVGDGGVVTLRGRVADGDEARLVEGMIRLTPGVREIKNELDFPR
ncbi:MAG: BON domain-containing protein, partial [Gemmataceae bacterium]|nr:BON domain-containing protein [Gemmataceae bacterium]